MTGPTSSVASAAAVMFLACSAGTAQVRTDFAGVWEMDAARSESAHQAVPIGPVTLVIKQDDSAVTIETRRRDRKTRVVSSEVITYRLTDGGGPGTGGSAGEVQASARWNGPELIAETARNVRGATVTTRHVMSVDASGKELTIYKVLTVQHGYQFQGANNTGTGTDVFVKQKGKTDK